MSRTSGAEQKNNIRRGRPKKNDHREKKKPRIRARKAKKVITNEERCKHERDRLKEITMGVEELKSRIPYLQHRPKRVSQEKILKLAISYIRYLREFLRQQNAGLIEEPFDFEAEVKRVLQTEEKSKRSKKNQKDEGGEDTKDSNGSSNDE
ncbi:unnamed protein product [Caenorhabditis brenneri]